MQYFINNLFKLSVLRISFFISLLISCSGSASDEGGSGPTEPVDVIPSELSLSVNVIGADDNQPNGDGFGVVEFTASATNGVSYSFRFGTGDSKTSSGTVQYTYTEVGTKTYDVKVLAYSSTNNYISIDKKNNSIRQT